MAREIWKGTISFGLVNIPVNLYSGEKSSSLKFSLLDRRDLSPVGYQRINKESGKDVPWDEIVKGFEYEKGQHVVLSPEDFRQANVKGTQTVEIMAFVKADEIDMMYIAKPYVLTPGKKGEKGYALLREVLQSTGKIGIAQLVIHTRQHIAAVMPRGNLLLLELLRYADELRDVKEFEVPDASPAALGITKKELDMAERLVDGMTEKWSPEDYHDNYRDDLLSLIEAKVKAGEAQRITEPGEDEEEVPHTAEVIDLMKLLKRSVEAGGKAKPEATPASGAKPKAKANSNANKTAPAKTPGKTSIQTQTPTRSRQKARG